MGSAGYGKRVLVVDVAYGLDVIYIESVELRLGVWWRGWINTDRRSGVGVGLSGRRNGGK